MVAALPRLRPASGATVGKKFSSTNGSGIGDERPPNGAHEPDVLVEGIPGHVHAGMKSPRPSVAKTRRRRGSFTCTTRVGI
jgi:hypothetical protein